MKIGLYFGSFNPVHLGHVILAHYMAYYTDLDRVWLVLSPQNPWKPRRSLLANHHRLEMLRLAILSYEALDVSDIELHLPMPSYTIDTLTYLEEKYPQYHFRLIIGADHLTTLHKWKNASLLIKKYPIMVYPRPCFSLDERNEDLSNAKNHFMHDAPQMDISSTFIRDAIAQGKDIRPLVASDVWKYIDHNNLYR